MHFCGCDYADTMADVNVNVNAPDEQAPAMAPPTRTDDQILPRSRWVPVGKSNCYLDVEKSQNNPIYKITVDILKHANFFRAFIASSTIPFSSFGTLFDMTKPLGVTTITPVDNNNAFSSPPTLDVLIKFVNNLGYPKAVRTLSDVVTNDMFQPWRALTTIINLSHIDYAERMWEEFTQSIHTFIEDKKNLARHTQGRKKANLIVIPSVRYLKFSAKGTKREVFGMPIPNNLITADIQGEQYYNAYLEKVAKHQRYLAGEEVSDPDSPAPKPAKATKPKATKQSKPLAPKAAPESSEAPSLAKQPKAGKVIKKRTQKSSLQLVDEFVDEGVPVNEPRFGDEEADMQKAVEESLKDVHAAHQGPLPPVVIREPESRKFQPLSERRTPVPTEPSGYEESSSLYVELGLTDSETESGDDVSPKINPEAQDKGHARPNPGKQVEGQAGSNPDDAADSQPQPRFIATAYPKVQENLKLTVEEYVILEEPASSTGTLSSLQHLAKDFSFGDQFFNYKPFDAENKKTNAEIEAESMMSVTIHQDTSAIPPMTSPVIDLISRPDSSNEHRPLLATATATTTTTITTLPLPPQPQQSTTDSILIKRIGELEQHMVSKVVDEIITDAVDWAIQAPLRDHFRDLPEADMKEILHHRMWETNSYKAYKDHKKLYEALEKSMDRDHSDQLLTDLAEARRKKKKRHDLPKILLGSPPH
ncbi:hypothetical protein Tco_0867150 [Tanacetum coccineum]